MFIFSKVGKANTVLNEQIKTILYDVIMLVVCFAKLFVDLI